MQRSAEWLELRNVGKVQNLKPGMYQGLSLTHLFIHEDLLL